MVNEFVINFIVVLIFVLWIIFSSFAVAYWMKTPKDVMEKIIIKDLTKGWLFWYGFYFSIFLVSGCFFSFVAFLAMNLSKGF